MRVPEESLDKDKEVDYEKPDDEGANKGLHSDDKNIQDADQQEQQSQNTNNQKIALHGMENGR